ncbi:hypothetical protein PO909_028218 [Leuciscus waleckii]
MFNVIGNACLKIVEEAAQRHGKVHIVDLYVVPIWKDQNVDPVHCLPASVFSNNCKRPSYSAGLGTQSWILILWEGDRAFFSADERKSTKKMPSGRSWRNFLTQRMTFCFYSSV